MQTASSAQAHSPVDESVKKSRSYAEIVHFLDTLPPYEYSQKSLDRLSKLDELLDTPSEKIDTIAVGGTNGKSSTMHFATKLFREEGYSVATLFSSHFLNYTERIRLNSSPVTNKAFSQVVGRVIDASVDHELEATSLEILLVAGLLYAQEQGANLLMVETADGGMYDPTVICKPLVAAITRVADSQTAVLGDNLDDIACNIMGFASKDSWLVSAEQSKLRLQKMRVWAEERGYKWGMPIRKLATLPYIYRQLYGRSASLAERIVRIYVEEIKQKFSPFLRENLLVTERGQRGRPTLEAKRNAELNPVRTLKQFWYDNFNLLRGRFEVLDKEKPTVLLDNASNFDAFENLFLGIRLLHYQRALEGFVVIISLHKAIDLEPTLKAVRYLFKKVPGTAYFVKGGADALSAAAACEAGRNINLKTESFDSFQAAFAAAKEAVDERHGLVTVTGSDDMIRAYWKMRGMKRL